ncbi:MAG: hypothetical protein RLZZ488_1276 [Pseudomonadota bacterium]
MSADSPGMDKRHFIFSACFLLVACAASTGTPKDCSAVKSVAVANSSIAQEVKSGTLLPAWGGVIDFLESPGTSDNSKRSRCSVMMDYVPVSAGGIVNPASIAFWTADHCLDFSKAKAAELNIFDPQNKKYIRIRVALPMLEKYRHGLKLFEDRAKTAGVDPLAADDLATYLASAQRKSFILNDVPVIERGAEQCKADSQQYKAANPAFTSVCSTVLDMARVEAEVVDESFARPEVSEALGRMAAELKSVEESKFAEAEAVIPLSPTATGTLRSDFIFFLRQWRVRIGVMTRYRNFESQSALIDRVAACADGDNAGICAQEFRDFFKDAVDEYKFWVKDDAVGNVRSFPQALHDEVVSPDRFNIQWLLMGQEDIGKYSFIASFESSKIFFASNILRTSYKANLSAAEQTLGDAGPFFFGLATPSQMIPKSPNSPNSESDPTSKLLFKEKTLLVSYRTDSASAITMLLQPGDSGSVLLIGNTPIGVVATVDGVETSGGASVSALPEYTEEVESEAGTQAGNGTNSGVQVSCK